MTSSPGFHFRRWATAATPSAGSGRDRDFFRFGPNSFSRGRPNPNWCFEENGVVQVMRKLVGFNRVCTARRVTRAWLHGRRCLSMLHLQSRTTPSSSRLQAGLWPCFAALQGVQTSSRLGTIHGPIGRRKSSGRFIRNSRTAHVTTKSRTDCSRLPAALTSSHIRARYDRRVRDKIQMVHEPPSAPSNAGGNGSGK